MRKKFIGSGQFWLSVLIGALAGLTLSAITWRLL